MKSMRIVLKHDDDKSVWSWHLSVVTLDGDKCKLGND